MSRRNNKNKPKNNFLKAFGIICAIVFGFFLAYSLFSVLHLSLKLSAYFSIIISVFVVISFSLLVWLHKSSRCVFLLMIPQILSKKGRKALLTYVFFIAFTGPGANTLENFRTLSDSIICGEQQLILVYQEVVHAIQDPQEVIEEKIQEIVPRMKSVMDEVTKKVEDIKENIVEVVETIDRAFSWLASATNMCDKKRGTPFEKCEKSFQSTIIKCREKLGPFSVYCDVTYLAKMFCYTFKTIDYFCEAAEASDVVLTEVIKKTENFLQKVEDIFYVSVSVHHHFDFKTNRSNEIRFIHANIIEEIHARTDKAFKFFRFVGAFVSFFVVWMLITALHYKHKFLTDLRYKNIFINSTFHKIDEQRGESNLETVLPLTESERKSFVDLAAFKLVRHDYRLLFEKSFFLLFSTLHLSGILLADYSLFWLMSIIRFGGSRNHGIENEADHFDILSTNVIGDGVVAEMCRDLVDIFKPLLKYFDVDFAVCLPSPNRPNFSQYAKIGFLLLLCWFLLILEPFGLRIRRFIMDHHYPQRSLERTVWLYHHLLRKRTSFLKFARQQARINHLKNESSGSETMTCFELFRAKVDRFWICRKIFGPTNNRLCLLCGRTSRSDDDLIQCQTSSCVGIYCLECYTRVKNSCPMCRNPLEYCDLSDFSEELDSSDDDTTESAKKPKQ